MLRTVWNRGAILVSVFFLCAGPSFAGSKASQLPDGPGKATVEAVCSGCHPATMVLGHRDTKEGWAQVVSDMVAKGANGTDAEFNTIINYLAKHFPKNSSSKPAAKHSGSKTS
ncbi:MAG TPA: cytochrome c [Bryobacteraceae bacterium]